MLGVIPMTKALLESLGLDQEHTWVVQRSNIAELRLRYPYKGKPPIQEIGALRRIRDDWGEIPISEVVEMVMAANPFDIGIYPNLEARAIIERARELRLAIDVEDVSRTEYIPFDRTQNMALVIEDDDEARRICEALINAGFPVEEVEVD